ncbi:MAG: Cache 3/Cache 2 fusion domain-containing protein [Proteobacteria bacterium]|nr:Cache 3/Cache 2 fusion domain-containing protein [Pseudomonadota bacterium]
MKFSLKNKFLIPTITATILCLGVMSVFSFVKSKDALEKSIIRQVEYISASISKQVGNWIDERKSDLANFSQERILIEAADPALLDETRQKQATARLGKIKKSNDFFEFIAMANPKGEIVLSSDSEHIGSMNVSDRNYFKESVSGNIFVSEVIKSKASGNPVFCISAPVGKDNDILGVLLAVIDLNYFAKAFVDSEKVGETGYAYIMNNTGVILAYPDKSKILSLDISQFDFGRQMLEQKNGVIHYQFKEVDKVVAFSQEKNMEWIIASTANRSEVFAPINQIRNANMIIGMVCVAIIAAIIFLITRSIIAPINRIINGMEEGANQVAAASGQVSSSSQSLAEGASQQAASIEETSSSMEEMSSMTKQTAENSSTADRLMKDTKQVVAVATKSMDELTLSMGNISKASRETSKIIKTIDEIAFQTNLLALNAAVEAARAGEAGAGFAVVADEVRNLAMRAADAAKSTSELIEGTVKKVSQGSKLVSMTSDAFGEVAKNTDSVGDLIAEISGASREQSNGIEQVNNAISEMDKVVQQNAANAEESASASEEMNAQAEQLQTFVGQLVRLVTGKEKQEATSSMGRSSLSRTAPYPSTPSGFDKRRMLARASKEIRPDLVIPFDDDFKDF